MGLILTIRSIRLGFKEIRISQVKHLPNARIIHVKSFLITYNPVLGIIIAIVIVIIIYRQETIFVRRHYLP